MANPASGSCSLSLERNLCLDHRRGDRLSVQLTFSPVGGFHPSILLTPLRFARPGSSEIIILPAVEIPRSQVWRVFSAVILGLTKVCVVGTIEVLIITRQLHPPVTKNLEVRGSRSHGHSFTPMTGCSPSQSALRLRLT
jgi:hypothetical protein